MWPFTTGLTCPVPVPGDVVVAEIWPSLFPRDDDPVGTVRDAAQVRATAQALASADRAGALASWFSIDVPSSLRDAVEHEEGWILAPPNWWGAEAQRTS